MESHQFWAFFVIALIAGGAITLAISNATMTGYAFWDFLKPKVITTCKESGGVVCDSFDECLGPFVIPEGGYADVPEGKICCTSCRTTCKESGGVVCDSFDECLGPFAIPEGGYADVPEGKICCTSCRTDCSNCQNVLDMLGDCSTITIPNACTGITFTCNDVCNKIGKTCTQGLAYYRAYPGIPEFNESRYRLIECKSDIDCMQPIYGELSCMCCQI